MVFLYVSADYFTGHGMDESVLYHLKYGLGGAGFISDALIMGIGISILILGLILSYFIYKFLRKKRKNNPVLNILSYVLLFTVFVINPLTKNILEMNGYLFTKNLGNNLIITGTGITNKENNEKKEIRLSTKFEDNYRLPKIKTDIKSKNLVYIYLESFDNLYLDEEIFPGLSDSLRKIRDENISFTNIKQTYGTQWTIAGMVGSQCGIPLISPSAWNSLDGMKDIDKFLPGAKCVGDYLSEAGYDLNYIGGASLEFAGKGKFYKSHGFSNTEGKEELYPNLEDKNYLYSWGLYDDTLFDLAYKKYNELNKKNEKFALFMMNMDTHGNQGVISKSCDKSYNKDKNSILNAYYCSGNIVSGFVKRILENLENKDVIIVLSSDHFAMAHNNSYDLLNKNKDKRRLTFIIIDPSYNKSLKIDKKGTTLDIGATVLNKMGFNIDYLGLGVNLLGDKYTIAEKTNEVRKILSLWRTNYESFWNK